MLSVQLKLFEPLYRRTFVPSNLFPTFTPQSVYIMPDFTTDTYKLLLSTLLAQNYSFQPFVEFLRNPESRYVILRHDVDTRKMNSLTSARLENELGIKGTYYFRMVPESFDEEVIKQIYDLGHEIGYHYEDVSMLAERQKRLAQSSGLRAQSSEHSEEDIIKVAIGSFRENLEKLRKIVPVETICMHGSPLSRWDNRLLWKYYDYRDFGIVGEPYFDIDFEKVLYLTDTGRRWDGDAVSIRDKAESRGRRAKGEEPGVKSSGLRAQGAGEEGTKRRREGTQDSERRLRSGAPKSREAGAQGNKVLGDEEMMGRRDKNRFHSTFDIITAARENRLPDQIMLTVHPQRWDDRIFPWIRELVWQNVKNVAKRMVVENRRVER